MLGTAFLFSCSEGKQEEEKINLGDYPGTQSEFSTDSKMIASAEISTSEVPEDISEVTEEVSEVNSSDASVAIVKMTANDQMKFNTSEIRVKAGQTVKLTLKHTGKLPKNAMGHNFVLLKKGTNLQKFSAAATAASANDYIPENSDAVIAYTPMLGGGDEATIEFKAPEKGTYTFICSFPGHFYMMKGEFIVE